MNVPRERIAFANPCGQSSGSVASFESPIKLEEAPREGERGSPKVERGNMDGQRDEGTDKVGAWTLDENAAYLQFIKEYPQHFSSERRRRREKVFFRLSQVVKTRTPEQCRSHHQKLVQKFGKDFSAIIKYTRRKMYLSRKSIEFDECPQHDYCELPQPHPAKKPAPLPQVKPSVPVQTNRPTAPVKKEETQEPKVKPRVIRIVLDVSTMLCY